MTKTKAAYKNVPGAFIMIEGATVDFCGFGKWAGRIHPLSPAGEMEPLKLYENTSDGT
jgi:hypothetical protein